MTAPRPTTTCTICKYDSVSCNHTTECIACPICTALICQRTTTP
jgi:hypothetical protein